MIIHRSFHAGSFPRFLLASAVFFLASCPGLSAQGGGAADPQYVVPLKTAYSLSGSFGELRGNHYHAGLDMGTAGVENVEVHAAERGWVSRVKVGPYGYGRALYLSHPDGHTTVYGHLNGFAPKIDSLVRRRQYELKSYDVEIFLPKGQVPVMRDEVVALSGNTGGSGGPHLHFEVRDSRTEEPLNPLRFIKIAPDVTPPTIYGVKIYALEPDAQVAGASADRYYQLNAVSGRTIECCGTVGLGIDCTDFFERGGRPCGVVEIALFADDALVYKSRVDHFPFSLNRHVNSHIDFAEKILHNRFIQRSFVSPGNKLPIYGVVSTPTCVKSGEVRRMRYEVKDFAGNVSKVSFSLRGVRNDGAKPKPRPQGELVRWQRTWAKDTLGVDVLIPRETFYDDQFVAISRTDRAKPLMPVFNVGDRCVPIQKPVTLTMAVPEVWKPIADKVYVGRVSASGLSYCGGSVRTDFGSSSVLVISAKVMSLGSYTLDVDTVPPSVRVRNKYKSLRMSDVISIGVSDAKSGISKYSVLIDGQWQVFEYDYKNNRLKATPGYLRLSKGRHQLRAEVEDSCGNVRTIDWNFSVI